MGKSIPTLFLFWLGITTSVAQNFYFRQIKPEDGLPSSIVYQFAQDSEGLLWMGTENGLCAYDGSKFQYYTIQDGLPSNTVYRLAIDKKDQKWLTTLANQPCVFADGKGTIPPWADSLYFSNFELSITSDSLIWLLGIGPNGRQPLVIITPDGIHKTFSDIRPTFYQVVDVNGVNILWEGQRGVYHFKRDSILKFVPNQFDGAPIECSRYGDDLLCFLVEGTPGRYKYKRLVQLDPNTATIVKEFPVLEQYKFETEANCLLLDEDQNIWIGLRTGLLLLRKEGESYHSQLLLEGVFVNRVFQDREGNIWIGTEGDACFLINSTEINTLVGATQKDRGAIRALTTDEAGNIYIGYTDGSLAIYDARFQLLRSQKLSTKRIVDIQTDANQLWVASDIEVIELMPSGLPRRRIPGSGAIKCLLSTADDLFVFSTRIIQLNAQKELEDQLRLGIRVYNAYSKNDSILWLGTAEGLYTYHRYSKVATLLHPAITSDVRAIVPGPDQEYWIATLGQGVLVWKAGEIIQRFNQADQLSSDICNDLILDDHYAWVGTNMGLSKIDLKTHEIEIFGVEDGLSSREVNYLTLSGSNILAATAENLNIIPRTIQKNVAPPLLHWGMVKVGADTLPIADVFRVPYDQKNLFVSFRGISYRNLGNITYAYQMEGLDPNWIETRSPFANWSGIPSGVYTLRLKARGGNALWSEEKQIEFTFEAPFWERKSFKLAAVLLIIAMVGLGLWLYVRNLKQKNAIQRRIQDLQLTAMRAQMNPHFMFNALSSIQEFINRIDLESANLYLSQFASLVRSILNNSTKSRISLAEETEQLELYLMLENLRFKEAISFSISIDPPLEKEATLIPSMLIQPFVENALLHGLFHKEGDKRLAVRFKPFDEQTLLCSIQDSGIGRAAAAQINQRKTYKGEAKGIAVTRDRLALLNEPNNKEIVISFEDLYDPIDHSPLGTQVNLLIPFKLV